MTREYLNKALSVSCELEGRKRFLGDADTATDKFSGKITTFKELIHVLEDNEYLIISKNDQQFIVEAMVLAAIERLKDLKEQENKKINELEKEFEAL